MAENRTDARRPAELDQSVVIDLRTTEAAVAPTRVVVVDDHRFLVQMLVDRLNERGFEAMAVDVLDETLVERLRGLRSDVILLDAVFDDDEDAGLRVLRELAGSTSSAPAGGQPEDSPRIVMLTGVTGAIRIAELLDAGAVAVISKSDSFDGVLAKIEDVIAGIDPLGATRRQELAHQLVQHRASQADQSAVFEQLSEREQATLQALVDGRTVDEIAARRTVASSTVRSQVRAVLRKLGVHSQIEAVALAARHGLRPSEPAEI